MPTPAGLADPLPVVGAPDTVMPRLPNTFAVVVVSRTVCVVAKRDYNRVILQYLYPNIHLAFVRAVCSSPLYAASKYGGSLVSPGPANKLSVQQ